ncbi:UNVERIFIED_CONTAM: hypothetical protein FKN15_047680 [Acipenser sinensis]
MSVEKRLAFSIVQFLRDQTQSETLNSDEHESLEEAATYFKKALVLDPENDTYKSNLKMAEQKLKEASSPTGTGLGFDMASLINNPAFITMAASVMQNRQVQQLGQQFAQQIQQQNPELIEQLRNHIRSRSFSGSAEEHS